MVGGLLVIGTSLGGMAALDVLLGGLSKGFPWPVAIVQHRSAEDVGDGLVALLQRHCPLPLTEVEDGDPLASGHVYIAPPDYHLLVDREVFSLSTGPRECWARPSIDVLFDSAAAVFGEGLVGVILTGASSDGAHGAARVKAEGGTVFVQDPLTAESPVMPRAAIAATSVDRVLGLAQIADALNRLAARRR